MSPTFLLGTTSAERLLEFNLITGAQIANSSVTGLAEITGLRGSLGTAIVRGVDGNYSTVTLSTGAATEFSYSAPTGDDLVSAEFVQGSASTAILLYRGTNGSLLVLYDLATTHVTGTLALGQDVAEAEGIAGASSVYAFVRTTQGVEGWAESAGTFTPFTNLTETGVADYSLVQYGSGILVYSLSTTGNSSAPVVTLDLAEIGASIPPLPSGGATRSSSGSSPTSDSIYALYLAITAAAVALLLGVVAVLTRRRPPKGESRSESPSGTVQSPDSAPSAGSSRSESGSET